MGSTEKFQILCPAMAALARNFNKFLLQQPRFGAHGARLMSTDAHAGGSSMWKKLTFFAIILANVNAFSGDHEEKPEFIPYDHLRIRSKKFPWGDGNKSLFHNPHVNALPDGYEEE